MDNSSLDSVEASTKSIGSSSVSSISSTEGSESLRSFVLFKRGFRLSSTGELADELELASERSLSVLGRFVGEEKGGKGRLSKYPGSFL